MISSSRAEHVQETSTTSTKGVVPGPMESCSSSSSGSRAEVPMSPSGWLEGSRGQASISSTQNCRSQEKPWLAMVLCVTSHHLHTGSGHGSTPSSARALGMAMGWGQLIAATLSPEAVMSRNHGMHWGLEEPWEIMGSNL